MLRCAVNVPTSTFQPSPWSLRAKLVFRKSLFTISKITLTFGHVTNYELTHFKKTVQVEKQNHYYFVQDMTHYSFFEEKNQITFTFIKTMSHDLLVQVVYYL